jgi:uncharacterized GH25 family protein
MFGKHTDERGIGLIELPEPGAYKVFASTEGRSVSDLVQAVQGMTPVELRFPAGIEVSGQVVDAKGEGLPGVSLTLTDQLDQPLSQSTWSDRDGTFAFRQVPDGAYRLTARREGFVQSGEPRQVVVAGSDIQNLGVQLEPVTGATLKGHLLGLKPEEVARASIQAYGPEGSVQTMSESDGRYEIQGLRPGDWSVTAIAMESRRQMQQRIQIQPGEPEAVLDFDFSQGSTLSGRVLLDGSPLVGAEVTLWSEAFGVRQAQSRYDGRFEIRSVTPGRYRLTLLASRGAVSQERTVEIDGDREMTIDVPTGVLKGRILGDTGEPILDAMVSIDSKGNDPRTAISAPTTRSADDGLFESRLATGTYKIKVQKDGYAPAEATVEVRPGPAGAPVEIRLKLVPAPG